MTTELQTNRYPPLSVTYVLIFCTGVACMAVAGYFLVQGLSEFAGTGSIAAMLIIGGILFQVTESICFISASALTYHSMRWRYILFSLGAILFCFSIAVMTLAQKTALQSGESQAQAIDERRDHLRQQIISLDKVIDSYRFNAERQSKSIYKDSRAKGQDSLNRAAKLEQKKFKLSEELFALNKKRRETSSDFFKRVESVLGLPAASTEFYFLVLRSLLLELSAIILMSFAANLRAYNQLVIRSDQQSKLQINEAMLSKAVDGLNRGAEHNLTITNDVNKANQAQAKSSDKRQAAHSEKSVSSTHQAKSQLVVNEVSNATYKKTLLDTDPDPDPDPGIEESQESWEMAVVQDSDKEEGFHLLDPKLNDLVNAVVDMYEHKVLKDLSSESIKECVHRYLNQKLTSEKAGLLSELASDRLDQPC